jgi:signal transduction histidine kinase
MVALAPLLGPEPELETGERAYTDLEKRGIVFSSRIPYTEGERIVMVSVRDTGPGIEAKNLSSIFEPFFTTKEKSKGTGLGLSICQRIVEGIGGLLRVQGSPGKGTVVTCFFLPEREDASMDGDIG